MKGQHQGIWSTKTSRLDTIEENEVETHIKIEGEPLPMRVQVGKHNFIFVKVLDLTKTVHTNQTGAFLYISQRGNRYTWLAYTLMQITSSSKQ